MIKKGEFDARTTERDVWLTEVRQNEADRREKYLEQSKERLRKLLSKFINTTMIGSLAAIEKHLPQGETVTQEELSDMLMTVRQTILDNGNKQIRNMTEELKQYEVDWKRYHMTLPVKGANNE